MLIHDLSLRCPCCGYKTLSERSGFEICAVCFWEDDGQDDDDADEVLGGPNGYLNLTQDRANFQEFGASRKQDIPYVRPPLPDEI
ncbi:CPCC family cysteine-rich protein [Aeromonas veronii]